MEDVERTEKNLGIPLLHLTCKGVVGWQSAVEGRVKNGMEHRILELSLWSQEFLRWSYSDYLPIGLHLHPKIVNSKAPGCIRL